MVQYSTTNRDAGVGWNHGDPVKTTGVPEITNFVMWRPESANPRQQLSGIYFGEESYRLSEKVIDRSGETMRPREISRGECARKKEYIIAKNRKQCQNLLASCDGTKKNLTNTQ